jgi:putative hemolysin
MIESLIIVIFALVFSAYFSGIEIAFVSSNKLQIELWNKQGLIAGKIFSKFHNNASKFIGFALVGNTLALVIYGIFMANLLHPILINILPENVEFNLIIIIIQTLISTIVVLITAEFLPKSIFMLNPNKMLSIFALPTFLLYYIFFPIVTIIVSFSQFIITNLLKIPFSEDKPVYGFTDLNNYLKNSLKQKSQEDEEKFVPQIFHNAMEFKDVKIRECMIPRTEIIAIDIEEGMEGLKKIFIES